MKKLLIVEDEIVSRLLLTEMLQRHFEICHTAVNGREAVDSYLHSLEEHEPYDLICLDIMMPEMDGQAALEEIRKIEKERGIGGNDMVKVLMVTALSGAKDIMGAFMKGACEGYLTKPISPEKLEEYLKKFGLHKSITG
ncbi:MAG: response regulator [Desulfobulbaceae bacterium]|nr:response regulator [Desulfobulbaceae bacterium]